MNNLLIDAAFHRARTTLLLMAMVVIAGVVARCSIPIESSPNIEVPVFVVGVPHPGISPEDAERLLVKPLEVELRVTDGIEEVRGTASEGFANVVVEFDASYDLVNAMTSPEAGAYEIENWGFGHANKKAFDLVDDTVLEDLGLSTPEALLNNGIYFAPIAGEIEQKYVRLLDEVKAGF